MNRRSTIENVKNHFKLAQEPLLKFGNIIFEIWFPIRGVVVRPYNESSALKMWTEEYFALHNVEKEPIKCAVCVFSIYCR